MRPISILTLVAVLSGVSCSRTTPSEVPRAVVVPEVVDLGRIEIGQQEKKSGEFLLRNRGTGPLTIFERAVSCGCTVPDWPPSIIPAGGEALVRLTVSAKREAGAHGSVISFATNDPHNPILRIPIRWLERSAVAFDPKSLDFGRVENGKAVESTIGAKASGCGGVAGGHLQPQFSGQRHHDLSLERRHARKSPADCRSRVATHDEAL